jgi:hypothetical protein
LCACASLHPDPNTEEEEMFGSEWVTSDQFDGAAAADDDDDETATDGNVAKWRRTE